MNTSFYPTELLGFLKSIASESRINILMLFLDGQERTVQQITQAVGLGQSATSEHLALMKTAGILTSRKDGKEVYYRPDRKQILAMLDALTGLLRNCCN